MASHEHVHRELDFSQKSSGKENRSISNTCNQNLAWKWHQIFKNYVQFECACDVNVTLGGLLLRYTDIQILLSKNLM